MESMLAWIVPRVVTLVPTELSNITAAVAGSFVRQGLAMTVLTPAQYGTVKTLLYTYMTTGSVTVTAGLGTMTAGEVSTLVTNLGNALTKMVDGLLLEYGVPKVAASDLTRILGNAVNQMDVTTVAPVV